MGIAAINAARQRRRNETARITNLSFKKSKSNDVSGPHAGSASAFV